ncbi:MAG: septum formation protein Maf [Chloroflexi bacterium]|nr:septum formation protein Maf [Chloroflexota bacterium]
MPLSPTTGSLVLASASPRRRDLLDLLGLPFRVAPTNVDETPLPGEAPPATAVRLAGAKVRACHASADEVVLSADTVVWLRYRSWAKPESDADARQFLGELCGRSHRVTTAVAVGREARLRSGAITTTVALAPLSATRIQDYVDSGDPRDKAGGYAIQNERVRPVKGWEGCRCNVVGLPLGLVAALLADTGIAMSHEPARACPAGYCLDCSRFDWIDTP